MTPNELAPTEKRLLVALAQLTPEYATIPKLAETARMSEGAVRGRIASLRYIWGSTAIQTKHGKGYRLNPRVLELAQ